jgi:hypothetical protein
MAPADGIAMTCEHECEAGYEGLRLRLMVRPTAPTPSTRRLPSNIGYLVRAFASLKAECRQQSRTGMHYLKRAC